MSGDHPAAPAHDLRETVQQAITDLAEVAQWLPGVTPDEAGHAAAILERLSEETAEAAAMIRALPARPPAATGGPHVRRRRRARHRRTARARLRRLARHGTPHDHPVLSGRPHRTAHRQDAHRRPEGSARMTVTSLTAPSPQQPLPSQPASAQQAVDYLGPVHLYEQVAAILRDQISSGQLPPGPTVPSIPKLIQQHKVSHHTARRALEVLEKEQLVRVLPGRGIFVLAKPPG
jgi:GntR family transcriptional regulator